MRPLKVSEDMRPVSDLKAHSSELVRQVSDTGRPIVLSRHGRAVAVLMSVEDYEEFQEIAEQRSVQRAVDEAEADVLAGRMHTHEDVMRMLGGWAKRE